MSDNDPAGRAGQSAILDAIVRAAVDATAASRGWLVRREGERLVVVAAAGDQPGEALGRSLAAGDGSAGYVIESGQPLAMTATGDDARATQGISAELGDLPTTLLCVPATTEDAVVGALELVDKRGGGPFTIDDVEVATMLGGVAGAAIEATGASSSAPTPSELAGELERLAANDPGRYSVIAETIAAVLARG